LLDAYRDFGKLGHDWYKDFAEEGDDWFKAFMETAGTQFKERFEKFKRKRKKLFKYPSDGNEQIKAWRARLDDWGKEVVEIEGEVLQGKSRPYRVPRR